MLKDIQTVMNISEKYSSTLRGIIRSTALTISSDNIKSSISDFSISTKALTERKFVTLYFSNFIFAYLLVKYFLKMRPCRAIVLYPIAAGEGSLISDGLTGIQLTGEDMGVSFTGTHLADAVPGWAVYAYTV